mgnify:FL=1
MAVVEIELPIKGNKEDIDKLLLNSGFEEFHKVITITSYYKLKNDNDMNHNTLKSRCKRLRYVEPLSKFKNKNQSYKQCITKYNVKKCKKDEEKLLNDGYEKIYTDEKIDYVYKNKNDDEMYFQIQDIKDDCLIIAYDNKKYYDLPEDEQKKKLINDVRKYGIEIIEDNNVDRFKLIGKTLTIEEIVDKMNYYRKKLSLKNSLNINCDWFKTKLKKIFK